MDGDSEVLQLILAGLTDLKGEMAAFKSEIRAEIAALKSDVAQLKTDVAQLKTENAKLRSDLDTLRIEMHNGFERIHDDLREIRAIQDAHGRELNAIHEGVNAINQKLAKAGAILGSANV